MKLAYDKQSTGWCGYYTLLNQIDGLYYDLTPFDTVSFMVRGEKGGEDFELGLADRNWMNIGDSLKAGTCDKIPGRRENNHKLAGSPLSLWKISGYWISPKWDHLSSTSMKREKVRSISMTTNSICGMKRWMNAWQRKRFAEALEGDLVLDGFEFSKNMLDSRSGVYKKSTFLGECRTYRRAKRRTAQKMLKIKYDKQGSGGPSRQRRVVWLLDKSQSGR